MEKPFHFWLFQSYYSFHHKTSHTRLLITSDMHLVLQSIVSFNSYFRERYWKGLYNNGSSWLKYTLNVIFWSIILGCAMVWPKLQSWRQHSLNEVSNELEIASAVSLYAFRQRIQLPLKPSRSLLSDDFVFLSRR